MNIFEDLTARIRADFKRHVTFTISSFDQGAEPDNMERLLIFAVKHYIKYTGYLDTREPSIDATCDLEKALTEMDMDKDEVLGALNGCIASGYACKSYITFLPNELSLSPFRITEAGTDCAMRFIFKELTKREQENVKTMMRELWKHCQSSGMLIFSINSISGFGDGELDNPTQRGSGVKNLEINEQPPVWEEFMDSKEALSALKMCVAMGYVEHPCIGSGIKEDEDGSWHTEYVEVTEPGIEFARNAVPNKKYIHKQTSIDVARSHGGKSKHKKTTIIKNEIIKPMFVSGKVPGTSTFQIANRISKILSDLSGVKPKSKMLERLNEVKFQYGITVDLHDYIDYFAEDRVGQVYKWCLEFQRDMRNGKS